MREEAEPARGPPHRPRPHPRPVGHLRAAGHRRGEDAGRRPGTGHGGAIVSVVDRSTKIVFLERVDSRISAAVSGAILDRLGPDDIPAHTLTSDNGREFAGHASVSSALEADFCFVRPHHPWERSLNEHTNGLACEYLPKGTDFPRVSDADARAVETRLNRRPRRIPCYRIPEEAFAAARPPP